MKNKIMIVVIAIATVTGWQAWRYLTAPGNSEENVALEAAPELNQQQQEKIQAHNDKMQALIDAGPSQVPDITIPNVQPLKLPKIKTIDTVAVFEESKNEQPPPDELFEDIAGENSSRTTQASLPVIDSVSRYTGIPAGDIEEAFNK